ncbi:COG4223 family protein [Ollibium composti]|uniref:Phage tail protein n=1 Tax=Ollibium composti TaxID=2675109 RepID=A0ABY2Q8A8_9HYPH|nr:COG4223 family protein [Mesorhizobium composti]THF57534.1 phage tail protein [Mesorhizobium composti]
MVKTPKTRHSKQHRQPVTIELEPGEVSRVDDGDEDTADAQAPDNVPEQETPRAESADFEPWEHKETASPEADRTAAPDEPASRYASDYGFAERPTKETTEELASNGAEGGTGDRPDGRAGPSSPRDGALGRVGAGVIGGLIALLGAGALQYAGLLGAPGGNAGGDLGGQIAALKGELAALKNSGGNGTGTRIDGLSAALDQVKADVVTLKAALDSGQGGDNADLAALSDKVAGLEKAVAGLGQGGEAQPVDLGPVNEKLGELEAQLKSAGDAAGEQQSKLAMLEQSLSQLSAKVEAQASQPRIALAIAAAALKSALDRGAPFAAELDTFAAIAPDAPEIAALRAYADKGVPTRAAIAGEVDTAANAMVAAAKPVDPNAGIFQRLMSSAESLVEVRPIGAVEGKGVPETVARLEVAVNQGDYAKALAEYDTLPEAAKAAGAGFAGKLKARLDVEAQLDALISGAMKA